MRHESTNQKLKKVSAGKESLEGQNDELAKKESLAYIRESQNHEAHLNNQNLGLLGKLFGAKSNAVTNIAGLSALLAGMVIIACVGDIIYLLGTDKQNVKELISVPSSMASLALGYLFGKSGK
jgi:hypothetical protein